MKTKECPSCGSSAPKSALRCKECFHDFSQDAKRSSGGPIFLLAALAAMAVVGAGVLWFVTSSPVEERILVDEGTQSVVWTRRFNEGVQTERLRFEDISELQYVISAGGGYEVVAVASNGQRYVIHEGPQPLKSEADQYAEMMDRPLSVVDQTRGFHKLDDE